MTSGRWDLHWSIDRAGGTTCWRLYRRWVDDEGRCRQDQVALIEPRPCGDYACALTPSGRFTLGQLSEADWVYHRRLRDAKARCVGRAAAVLDAAVAAGRLEVESGPATG